MITSSALHFPDAQDEDSSDSGTRDERDPEAGLELTNTAFCGFALQRLSWRTLTWLVDVHNERHGNLGTPFEMFLKQSLHHSLADPHRLHVSAQSWNNDQDEGRDDHKTQDDETVNLRQDTGVPSKLPNSNSSAKYKTRTRRFDTHRSLEAFDMLATLGEGTEKLYAALHTTVQQCYTIGLPHRSLGTQNTGLKSLKRSGGGMRKVEATVEAPRQQLLGKTQVAEIFLSVTIAEPHAPLQRGSSRRWVRSDHHGLSS